MAKKPIQFQVSDSLKKNIEAWVQDQDTTLSEFLRQSVKLHMILKEYLDQGYVIVLRKKDGNTEKEIILP